MILKETQPLKVLRFLAGYKAPGTRKCIIYVRDIADEMQLSGDAVRRCTSALVREGLLTRDQCWLWESRGDYEYPGPNKYKLTNKGKRLLKVLGES